MGEQSVRTFNAWREKFFSQLRIRLLIFIAFILLPTSLMLVIESYSQRGMALDYVQQDALQIADLAAVTQRQLIDSTRQMLVTLSNVEVVREARTAECDRLFEDLARRSPMYTNIFALLADGTTVCTGLPGTSGINGRTLGWFQESLALSMPDFYVSHYELGAATRRPVVTMSYPVLNPDGSVRLFIGASLAVDRLENYVDLSRLPENATMTILDRDGTILYRYPTMQERVGERWPTPSLVDTINQRRTGTEVSIGLSGSERLFGFTPLDPPNDSAYVVIGLDYTNVLANLNLRLIQQLVTLLLVGALSLLLGWFVIDRFLGRDVRQLVQGTERLKRGDLAARVPMTDVRKTAELRELGESFNTMAETLQRRQRELEETNMELARQVVERERAADLLAQARDFYEKQFKARTADLRFLLETSTILGSSLDYRETLNAVAKLAVPGVGDWCVIQLRDPHDPEMMHNVATAHIDPEKLVWAEEIGRKYPYDPAVQREAKTGAGHVLRTGQAELYPDITDEMLVLAAKDDQELLQLLRDVGYKSVMIVPIEARGQVLGVLTLVSTNDNKHYNEDDLGLAQQLAQRAGIAIDNAQLFEAAGVQREQLQVTLASIGDAVITSDEDGCVTYLNRVAEELTGWGMDDAVGEPLRDVFHIISEETGQRQESPHDKVMQTGKIVGLANHTLLVRRDGQRLPIDDSGAPIRGENGKIIGTVLVFRDVTERRQQEVLLNTTFEKTVDLYRVSSRLGTTMTYNEALAAIEDSKYLNGVRQIVLLMFTEPWNDVPPLEYQIKAMLHEHLNLKGNVDEVLPLDEHPLYSYFRRGEPVLITNIYDEPDLNEPHIRAVLDEMQTHSIILLPLEAGNQWYGMLKLFSSSSQGWAQDELAHVRSLVGQTALVIDNIRLFQAEQVARKEAEQADELKLQFLAMISHELRTPLTSIKGFATTLLADDLDLPAETQSSFLHIIDEESDKLSELIDQLLDLSRMQAGTLRIMPEVHNFTEVLQQSQKSLDILVRDRVLTIHPLPDPQPVLYIDLHRITQVLINLVENAAKYSYPGQPIDVRASREKDMLRIEVIDAGPGILAEHQPHIFEPFRQVHIENQRQKGAGLGLAICKGLIEAHKGRLWIAYSGEKGTNFSFTLPVIPDANISNSTTNNSVTNYQERQ